MNGSQNDLFSSKTSRIFSKNDFIEYLSDFVFFSELGPQKTKVENSIINDIPVIKFINEFWTSKQRQANPIHEISYRACFKPQLPRFFIENLSSFNDIIYDPFSGRGTTIIEANLLSRFGIANDINPLSIILSKPRVTPPSYIDIKKRLNDICFDKTKKADIDLSMFFHPDTEGEIVSLKQYLETKSENNTNDISDNWIRMVATNRLTGHSKGFFSVYTLPPNQACSPESQNKINIKRNQKPEYRSVKEIILKKSHILLSGLSPEIKNRMLSNIITFLSEDARFTCMIPSNSVQLTVTSPPFLNIVQYSADNWMRCWFNSLDTNDISNKITVLSSITKWCGFMQDVFHELFRITKSKGWIAFEVGEIHKGKTKLDDYIIPLGINSGFNMIGVLINEQLFTKTSNIWGINNNVLGTNSNRIVIFQKP